VDACGQGEGVKNVIFVDVINGWPLRCIGSAIDLAFLAGRSWWSSQLFPLYNDEFWLPRPMTWPLLYQDFGLALLVYWHAVPVQSLCSFYC